MTKVPGKTTHKHASDGFVHLRLSSQASHWAAFAGKALISVGTSPAYRVRLPPAFHVHHVERNVPVLVCFIPSKIGK